MTIALIFIFSWLAVITFLLLRSIAFFNKLVKTNGKDDFKTILENILKNVEEEKKVGEEIKKALEEIKKDNLFHFQKIGFLRYNPFSETGGNQSFVLALLDGHDDGFVITSLHGREATRVFAKPVKNGKEAGYEFSKEEVQAIIEAQRKKR